MFHDAYADYARSRSGMAPDSFHQLAGIALCCAALSNRCYLEGVRYGRIYPSLWIGFIGPSTVRKSSAVNAATALLHRASADIELPQEFSREALIEHLSQRPFGLLSWSEFGSALDAMGADYNTGLISLLTDLWESRPSITRLTKGSGLVQINYPAVSILAAGKPRWFQESMRQKHVATGFLGRWLFRWEEKPRAYVPMFSQNGYNAAQRALEDSLVSHLQKLMDMERIVSPGPGSFVLDEWRESIEASWSDDDDPAEFAKRAGDQVAKLALGIQAGRLVLSELEAWAVQEAITIWEACHDDSLRLVAGIAAHNPDSDALAELRRILRRRRRATKSELLRMTRMTARTLDGYLDTLEQANEVSAVNIPSGGGRPITVYEWAGTRA